MAKTFHRVGSLLKAPSQRIEVLAVLVLSIVFSLFIGAAASTQNQDIRAKAQTQQVRCTGQQNLEPRSENDIKLIAQEMLNYDAAVSGKKVLEEGAGALSPWERKVDQLLIKTYQEYRGVKDLPKAAPIQNGYVVVGAIPAILGPEGTEALLCELEDLGLQKGIALGNLVGGQLPIDSIPAAVASTALGGIRAEVGQTSEGGAADKLPVVTESVSSVQPTYACLGGQPCTSPTSSQNVQQANNQAVDNKCVPQRGCTNSHPPRCAWTVAPGCPKPTDNVQQQPTNTDIQPVISLPANTPPVNDIQQQNDNNGLIQKILEIYSHILDVISRMLG